MAVILFILTQIGILGGDRASWPQGLFLAAMAMVIYTPLAYVDRPLRVAPHAGARGRRRRNPDGGALADGRPGPGEHLDRPPRGSEGSAADRSGRRAGHAEDRAARARRHRRRDPDHALPLRPRRRGRRDGALAPARRSTARPARSSSSRTSTTSCASRASGRSSPTRPRRRSPTATGCTLAGFEIDVIGTPGHSPDHVTYSIAEEKAIFSGDVLFQGSIGRTDLPGRGPRDADGLDRASCWTRCRARPACCPATCSPPRSSAERASNPFLHELA